MSHVDVNALAIQVAAIASLLEQRGIIAAGEITSRSVELQPLFAEFAASKEFQERTNPTPLKYVLAESYHRYVTWLLKQDVPRDAVYLDGQPCKGNRIGQGCLIKLENWHLNPGYTLHFRRALRDCAPPEDWTPEDVMKGLEL